MHNKTVYFLIDCSGSMYGQRSDAVNIAMQKIVREAIPEIKTQKTPDLNLNFVVLGFSDAHEQQVFEIMPKTALDDFNSWDDIDADLFNGGTPTGAAIEKVIEDLEGGGLHGDVDRNAVAPAIILISDGMPNGKNPTYEEVMQRAVKGDPKECRSFRRALRVAIGINVDEEGKQSLMKFGKLSEKMEAAGIASYYDCSDSYVSSFAEILKSLTLNLSIG